MSALFRTVQPVFWHTPRAVLLVLFSGMVALWLTSGALSGEPRRSSTSPAIRELVSQFQSSRTTMDERRQLVAQAVEGGPAWVEALLPVIEKQLSARLERYGQMFTRQAQRQAGQHLRQVDPRQVAAVREAVLTLRQRPDLTKEMIQQVGDPGLKQLQQWLVIPREVVLASSDTLRSEREKLSEWGSLWEECARVLYNAAPPESRPDTQPSFEEYLAGEETLAAFLVSPMDPPARQVLAQNAILAKQLQREEARCILALNMTRVLLGLNPLVIDLRLCAAARDHSNDMKTLGFFDHTSPVPGKTTPWDRARRFGTSASGENIAAGYSDGNAANMGWFHSPGHHKNMLGNHKRVGVGIAGTYYTELFGD
ncbi:CAP domain-containing protein [Thermogutta terrifontis]|uniref:CAP domain-containing protein n=1 Tax=Thermogutta terrifontis TaxID=1331910 RepID=UPI0012FDD0F0|nr:CAP domain-containing protein [Thermogutta terrifontis]